MKYRCRAVYPKPAMLAGLPAALSALLQTLGALLNILDGKLTVQELAHKVADNTEDHDQSRLTDPHECYGEHNERPD